MVTPKEFKQTSEYMPAGKIILTAIFRLYWREILETERSVREVRVQMRNEEGLSFNTDGRGI